MLDSAIRILDLDDGLTLQHNLLARYSHQIINLRDLGPKARLWLDKRTKEDVARRIHGSRRESLTFLGSGDFHHLTNILISEFEDDISVIVFDAHPDWETLPPQLGCGSWVSQTLKNRNILKLILIGISSSDISTMHLESANFTSLADDRLEIYPYQHEPSWVFLKRIPPNTSVKFKNYLFAHKIFWDEMKNKNLSEFILSVIKRLPSNKVYLSIDKDCLRSDYALTNWEEGMLSLDELLLMLKVIKENAQIIGADIVGDYSPVIMQGKIKNLCSWLDHPKIIKAHNLTQDEITKVNEKTNLKILEALRT
jgi:arginase family enzyme